MGAPDNDDDLVSRAPPPPDDRLWRHPSEIDWHIGRPPPPLVTLRPPAPDRGRWLIGLVAAAVAIGLTVGAVALVSRRDQGAATYALKEFGRRPAALVGLNPDAVDSIVSVVASGPAGRVDGTGIAVRTDGYVATSAWVVAGAAAVDVMLPDGTIHAARVVGTDPTTDVAVLHIEVGGLTPAPIARAAVGDPVEVPQVGDGTITEDSASIISADGTTLYGLLLVTGLPGDVAAGVPVLDSDASVLGLVSGAASAAGGGVYAVPARLVAAVAADIVEHGHAQIALLGVEGRDIEPGDRGRLGVAEGAVVGRVVDGSPAHEAGVQVDDVVVAVDGEPVTSMGTLIVLLRFRDPGDEVTLTIIRSGSPTKLTATLTTRPR